ncbi:MAG: tRNA pseudouridine(55) synthase TruB [Pseudomonadota bacterium]|nr:tRNA pseudouridine(55) synthase TruB [Pseudomonadota bacterium]
MHGWLVIDKPVGIGSTQVVAAVKRAIREGGYPKVKVGHGGTLDPLASGVLPVALGEATKLCGRTLGADKEYAFTISFGEETDTLDLEGEVVARSERRPTLAEVEAVLPSFTGAIEQVPPAYSALKAEGKRAYALARAGERVEMEPRRARVHLLQVRKVEDPHSHLLPQAGEGVSRLHPDEPSPACGRGLGEGLLRSVTLSALVSKGTYIRSLARDIARALDTVGHVTMLRRTHSGPFGLEDAISLDKVSELAKARGLEKALLPLAAGLDDIPALPVTPDQAGALRQGRKLAGIAAKPGLHLATDDDVPVALVELSEGQLRVVRGFNL